MENDLPNRNGGAAGESRLCAFESHEAQVTAWTAHGGARKTHPVPNARCFHKPTEASGKTAHADLPGSPRLDVIYLHVHDGDGLDVLRALEKMTDAPFALVAIRPAHWNDDLTPWECAGLFADDAPFAGRALEQMALMQNDIMPHIERTLRERIGETLEIGAAAPTAWGNPPVANGAAGSSDTGTVAWDGGVHEPFRRTIAGYSLAGLFATWAVFNSDAFSCVASASGSLWYPDFDRYAARHRFARVPECASFSLGTKEAKTPSRLLRNVATGTEGVIAAFRAKGVPTRFAWNPGNHFREPDIRMARAIAQVLNQPDPTE